PRSEWQETPLESLGKDGECRCSVDLNARKVLVRSHNLGRDLLVGRSAGQGAFEEAQAGGVAAAAEKALVESLRQVVLILSAAIDNVRDLRSGHACGQQLIKCGPTYRIDYSSQSVLVDRIEKTVVGPAGSILQVL